MKETSILNNVNRIGNFTSSEIVALTTWGKREMTAEELAARPKKGVGSRTTQIQDGLGQPAFTYIEKKNRERRLLRPMDNETTAKPLSWGKLLEGHLFQLLGVEYEFLGDVTLDHPTIDCWKGSPDFKKHEKGAVGAGDIKCPMTLNSFCQLVDLWELGGMHAIRFGVELADGREIKAHDDGDKWYWQIVSNAVITGAAFGELIVYVPYEDELENIRNLAHQKDGEDIHKYYWIAMGNDSEMPFLKRDGYYKNVNVMRFEIPDEDRFFITDRVMQASQKLVQPFKKTV